MKWANEQFFPAVWERYGNMKIYLVFDNSGNHTARSEGYVSPNAKKEELAKLLIANGVDKVNVIRPFERDPIRVRRGTKWVSIAQPPQMRHTDLWVWCKDDNGKWTTDLKKKELEQRVRQLYEEKPEIVKSKVEVLFAEGGPDHKRSDHFPGKKNFHRIIWSPPYHSDSNPIELIWATAKQYVAKHYAANRSMSQLLELLLKGFYGDGTSHDGVTAASCQKAIGHMEKVLNDWIRDQPRLSALFPTKLSPGKRTVRSLNATRRAAYGPVVAPHRTVRRKKAVDVPASVPAPGSAAITDPPIPPPGSAPSAPIPSESATVSASGPKQAKT